MSTQEFFEGVTTFFDLAGVAVLLGGLVLAVVVSARSVVRRDSASVTVVVFRSTFGRALQQISPELSRSIRRWRTCSFSASS